MFKKASKKQLKLRMALMGASGSGKTYTSLAIASCLGSSVAVIDTERGSASKYSDLFEFDVCELESFSPQQYINAIKEASKAGYEVLVIDSLSHAWMGKDGLLEQVDQIAKRKNLGGNTFAAWKDATPMQNALVDAILNTPCHVIVTMRTKTEYVIEKNDAGKNVPRKIGLAPVQRDQIEYEFDVVGEMNGDNELVVSKSRCSTIANAVISKPGDQVAEILKQWLDDGVRLPDKIEEDSKPVTAPQKTEQKQEPKSVAVPLSDLSQRVKELIGMVGLDVPTVKAICQEAKLPAKSADYKKASDVDTLRNKLFIHWGMDHGVFPSTNDAEKSLLTLFAESIDIDKPMTDSELWELWMEKIELKLAEVDTNKSVETEVVEEQPELDLAAI